MYANLFLDYWISRRKPKTKNVDGIQINIYSSIESIWGYLCPSTLHSVNSVKSRRE